MKKLKRHLYKNMNYVIVGVQSILLAYFFGQFPHVMDDHGPYGFFISWADDLTIIILLYVLGAVLIWSAAINHGDIKRWAMIVAGSFYSALMIAMFLRYLSGFPSATWMFIAGTLFIIWKTLFNYRVGDGK